MKNHNQKSSRTCKTCSFWRDKGWDEHGEGTGCCDNPEVLKQVHMMNEEMMQNFVCGNNKKDKKSNARFIKNSLRFKSDFGCIHHQKRNKKFEDLINQVSNSFKEYFESEQWKKII